MERDELRAKRHTLKTISTHTLTWSVTVDPAYIDSGRIISTHTLTWSVTQFAIKQVNVNEDFNSHAHVERDLLQT